MLNWNRADWQSARVFEGIRVEASKTSGVAAPPDNLGVAQLVERLLWEQKAASSRLATETN